eukprot:5464308-Amphidinium_carterae.1
MGKVVESVFIWCVASLALCALWLRRQHGRVRSCLCRRLSEISSGCHTASTTPTSMPVSEVSIGEALRGSERLTLGMEVPKLLAPAANPQVEVIAEEVKPERRSGLC